jgi:hypothetical protein
MNIQKGFASILFILLGLVVIGGGVYFYIENSQNLFQNNGSLENSQDFTLAGIWKFEEASKESSINGITTPTWEYTLIINKQDEIKGILNIDGYQTMTRLNIEVEKLNDSANVIFDSYAKGNQFEIYKKGDVLFTISPNVDRNLSIDWYTMQPNIENSKTNSIFVREDERKVLNKVLDSNNYSKPMILSVTGSTKNNFTFSPGESVLITGKNFLSGNNLSVYLMPFSANPANKGYVLQNKQVSDTSLVVDIPNDVDTNLYGGYKLVVENSIGKMNVPVNLLPVIKKDIVMENDIKLFFTPQTFNKGNVVTIKYQLSDFYKESDVLIDLINVSSNELFGYGNRKEGLALKSIDNETSSFILEDIPDENLILKKGMYNLCIWISIKGESSDCIYNAIEIK